MNIETFADIHSHHQPDDPRLKRCTIISVEPGATLDPDLYYSVGIHPWSTSSTTDQDLALLDAAATAPNVVAIGETGIDLLRGADPDTQQRIFIQHAALADRLGLPLIIHAVRSWDRLLMLKRHLRPSSRWIIHGFRGKPELARQLLDNGIDLSLGQKFNPATAAIIPDSRLFTETDESPLDIDTIRDNIAKCRSHRC